MVGVWPDDMLWKRSIMKHISETTRDIKVNFSGYISWVMGQVNKPNTSFGLTYWRVYDHADNEACLTNVYRSKSEFFRTYSLNCGSHTHTQCKFWANLLVAEWPDMLWKSSIMTHNSELTRDIKVIFQGILPEIWARYTYPM